jgi:hypothetical protein
VWLTLDSALDHQNDQARSLRPAVDLPHIEHITAPDSDQGNQAGSFNFQDSATHVLRATTSLASGSPHQPTGTPDRAAVTDSGKTALRAPDDRALCDYTEQSFTAQSVRTIGSVTISPAEVQHFFNV